MFMMHRPSDEQIRVFIATQRDQPFSYLDATTTENPPTSGYKNDHNSIKLGDGPATYETAVEALKRWEMFDVGWLKLCWPDAPIESGSVVAVLAHHLGFWSLNACRIVSVIDEGGEIRRFGFIYGTLPDHAERGHEQFSVEWRRYDDSVWYEIQAYSRPNALLARLGYPIARLLQKRFARDSMNAMVHAVL
ncbi:MAG TPA: DUF1990 domain-containing protein [Blastocatellia bacterium]|nr:DUF1990 domain-containing protein [Blastocatellia bacterium]